MRSYERNCRILVLLFDSNIDNDIFTYRHHLLAVIYAALVKGGQTVLVVTVWAHTKVQQPPNLFDVVPRGSLHQHDRVHKIYFVYFLILNERLNYKMRFEWADIIYDMSKSR